MMKEPEETNLNFNFHILKYSKSDTYYDFFAKRFFGVFGASIYPKFSMI